MTAHTIDVISPTLQIARRAVNVRRLPRQFRRASYTARPFVRRALSLPAARMYRVRGTVVVDPATPVARMVYLYSENDRMLAGRTLSDPETGAFEFPHVLGYLTYTAVAIDHTEEYRAEAHDGLVPEPMP